MEYTATLELNEKTDKLAVQCECPICHDKYLSAIPFIHVPCNKCGQTYKTDLKQDIYTKVGRRIQDILAHNNKIIIKATDSYRPALLHIKDNHERMNCWEVSEIKYTKEDYKWCTNCGTCMNCFQCTKCQTVFQRNIHKSKQKCPECSSTAFIRYHFIEAQESKSSSKIRVCPECKSEHIKMTRTLQKTKCHKCGSTKLTEARVNNIYSLTIERKKGYRIEYAR